MMPRSPAIALRLRATQPVRRVTELWSRPLCTRMVKYLIIAGVFGCVTLYSLWGVLALGFAALTETAQPERRFAFSLFVWWGGVLIVSTGVLVAAICRIVTLRRRTHRESDDKGVSIRCSDSKLVLSH